MAPATELECSCINCDRSGEAYKKCTHPDPNSPSSGINQLYTKTWTHCTERYEHWYLASSYANTYVPADATKLTDEQKEAIAEWTGWATYRATDKKVTQLEMRRAFSIFDVLFFRGRLQATSVVILGQADLAPSGSKDFKLATTGSLPTTGRGAGAVEDESHLIVQISLDPETAFTKGLRGKDRLTAACSTLLHEMVHAYLRKFGCNDTECQSEPCKRFKDDTKGLYGHGRAFHIIATNLQARATTYLGYDFSKIVRAPSMQGEMATRTGTAGFPSECDISKYVVPKHRDMVRKTVEKRLLAVARGPRKTGRSASPGASASRRRSRSPVKGDPAARPTRFRTPDTP